MQFGRHKTVGLNIKSLPKDISKNVLKLFQGGILTILLAVRTMLISLKKFVSKQMM